jgi:DNA-binding response OmpR family regulator
MQKANILIIEDHDAVRKLLGFTFQKDYEVTAKKDGIEAMAWLSQGNFPGIIMLDMQMPRLNGVDFLRQIRSSGAFSDIPVILVSANEDAEQNMLAYDLGVTDFVKKPFNPANLLSKVKNALAHSSVAMA